ncbi:hypothetical protein GCM10023322_08300 [Rugosimonospora acidiphila]|uniref:Ricin B lectin domain-containing protein n=1 Tax=Rugosimonospora acidiphila TaxID=556531 RepID=A0ABP9RLH5_9ACTN
MTSRRNLSRAWRQLTAARRGRLELTALGVVVVLLAGVAIGVPPAIADAQKITGKPVPADELTSVVTASLSCPTLTSARVAGQLMALTGFIDTATGSDLAGVTDTDWSDWKPAADAQRDDPEANILALGHQTCEMVGQLRAAGLDGDLWGPAIAAQRGGIDAVIKAKGVPDAQQTFVNQATGYAAWYADQPQFDVDAAPSPQPSGAPTAPVVTVTAPSDLVRAINAAGSICPEVTPARIAAQLKATSNFNANLHTDNGDGIAQFSTNMWNEYASGSQSVWNANQSIAVLGSAMCDLAGQFSGFVGSDPYTLALAAFQWGADTVRQAGGVPESTVTQLTKAVQEYIPVFRKDSQLNPSTKASPSPGASASPSGTPSAKPPASATARPSRTAKPKAKATATATATKKATPAPPAKLLYDPSKTYQIKDGWAGAILDLPGDNVSTLPSGTRVQLWTNQHAPDQYWKISAAPASGYVIITDNFLHKSLAVENDSVSNESKLIVEDTDKADPNQQWKLTASGDGSKVWITNHHSGKVMDLLGDDLGAPNPDGTWNGYLVEQWDLQTYAKDQRWLLVAS